MTYWHELFLRLDINRIVHLFIRSYGDFIDLKNFISCDKLFDFFKYFDETALLTIGELFDFCEKCPGKICGGAVLLSNEDKFIDKLFFSNGW